MRIWLVSIFEQTPVDKVFSTRFLSIADEAITKGHDVTFIGSTFKHNTKNQRFQVTTQIELKPNYRLLFIRSEAYKRNISIKRLWSHYLFSKKAIYELEKLQKPDVVLMAFPPISLAYEISKWAKRNDIPVVMDIIDPWPDTFLKAIPETLHLLGAVLLSPMRSRVRKTLRNLSGLTAISSQYIEWSKHYYQEVPRYEVLYPAADFSAIRQIIEGHKKETTNNDLTIIYAGSLASSYDIPCILEAARLLEDYPDIRFLIAGTGPQESIVEAHASQHENLTYLGRLPKDKLMAYYGVSDLGMTQHLGGATQSVTYKLFDLLAAGLPILNSLEGEMKDIILDNRVGLHNDPGNAVQLKENILFFHDQRAQLAEYRARGLDLAKNVGDTKVIYSRFVDLLESYGHQVAAN